MRAAIAEAAAEENMTSEEWVSRSIRVRLDNPGRLGLELREADDARVTYGPELSVVWEEWGGEEHLSIKVPVDDDTSDMLENGLWLQGTEIFMAWKIACHLGAYSTTEDIAHAAEQCVDALRPLMAAMEKHWKVKAIE